MAKMLITGASGQVGGQLIRRLSQFTQSTDEIYLLQHDTHVNTDAIDSDRVHQTHIIKDSEMALQGTYNLTLHLAAYLKTANGKKKEYEQKFEASNVVLTERVRDVSTRVIIVSTDQVFKGDSAYDYQEREPTNPHKNYYSITKEKAEKIILEVGGTIVRLQTMLGVPQNAIVDPAYAALDGGSYFPFWNNRFVKPAYFEDFLAAFIKIKEDPAQHIYHVACRGEPIARAKYAQKVLEVHQRHDIPYKNDQIAEEACTTDHPMRLGLDTTWTEQKLGLVFVTVDEAIERHVLATRKKNS
ncbi:MAG: sugar nucleotide-binding protein [Nanoarchaeota archaeon]